MSSGPPVTEFVKPLAQHLTGERNSNTLASNSIIFLQILKTVRKIRALKFPASRWYDF